MGFPDREYNQDLIRQFRQTAQEEMHTSYAFASILSVVWFQDSFALPIDEAVLERIKAIDRDRLAEAVCP